LSDIATKTEAISRTQWINLKAKFIHSAGFFWVKYTKITHKKKKGLRGSLWSLC